MGALMISLDVNHPDIEEFIDCKTDLSKVNYANISVRVSDEFMKAVEDDNDYMLKYPCDMKVEYSPDFQQMEYGKLYHYKDGYIKKIKAKDLFYKLAKNNWNYAEPGILYWDKIKNYNLLQRFDNFEYAGVNPCAEEPLPAGGSCLLGSLNLSNFCHKDSNRINYVDLAKAVQIAVKALNDVLLEGLSLHPLAEQRNSVSMWKQIGLGTMGLADLLIKLNIKYGSKESINLIENLYQFIFAIALEESNKLAKDKNYGPFYKDNYNDWVIKNGVGDKIFNSDIVQNGHIPPLETNGGLANSQLLTCAPTGSISTMLQVSGGIEPIFAMKYTRMTKSLEGKDKAFDVYTKIAEDYLKTHDKLSEVFVESKDIKPEDRIKVQATIQKYVDASISSTINLDESATIEDVYNIYMQAWKSGLKGVTVFRQNCARTAILSTNSNKEKEKKEEKKKEIIFDSVIPVSRKQMGVTKGCTFCKKCACGTLYITLNRDKDNNFVELFTHTSKGGICQANLNAETRMASLALRSGVKIAEVVDQLKGISCPACTAVKAKGGKVDGISCADIIAKTIVEFQKSSDVNIKEFPITEEDIKETLNKKVTEYEECPECHQKTLIREAGCQSCTSCGFSRCN